LAIRSSLLALLSEEPMYGARLRTEFEARTGGAWPLNVGQVYTTLARLERDGLVEGVGGPDEEGRIAYRLTDAGRAAAAQWWATPIAHEDQPRDELVIKIALAVTVPGVDVARLLQRQRTATMRHLHELTLAKLRLAADERPSAPTPEQLVLEHHLFRIEAELRWLDHVEATLAATPDSLPTAAPTTTGDPR
jgi:DNA-binding PadR family transcriptional regulator